MITPLMLLLSSINESFNYDKPVDILYLDRSDRTLILSEANRLGSLSTDPSRIFYNGDKYGNEFVDTTAVIGDSIIEIDPATAVMVSRIAKAYSVFKKGGLLESSESLSDRSLSPDGAILRIEGNPDYACAYVYNIMRGRGIPYKAKIQKIYELYSAIVGQMESDDNDVKTKQMLSRLSLHSEIDFWKELIQTDLLRHGYSSELIVTDETIAKVKWELNQLGFYGFVNPLAMYSEFVDSRVRRKTKLNISTDVVEYLRKVVLSGGVAL